ncbi:hypothetical protein HPP92_018813 [Vanilla planifolia]|uniref:Deoxynucleoside kinase domain-containing protein n=1 Tax=Vanilla planifolia TaxID=51239 RepID=A0A835UIS1_VANPL|nr:hypothetical protein HPP92_018813 [Vanilla planifolia]
MQKVWRGSIGSSNPVFKLSMPASLLLRFQPPSSGTGFGHQLGLTRRLSFNFICNSKCVCFQPLQRACGPLLQRTLERCPAWLLAGRRGRSFSVTEGFREREKRGRTEEAVDVEEAEEIVVKDEERKNQALQPQRRQRNVNPGGAQVAGVDLLTIPGVGPRNLRKLVDKGFSGVDKLKKLYKDKFFGKASQKMKIANETIELRDLVEIVPEPISKWQDIGPDHFNILDAFYSEPKRYAYTFQNYVFVTRVMQERESSGGIKPLRLMERSVFSDRMVFVRAVHEANWMNEMEISIYDSWFDPVVSSLPGLIPDGFIYLRASPDTCHKRMMLRQRSEEGGVTLNYLRDLHEKHESWLFPSQSGSHGVLSVGQLPLSVDNSLHPDIRGRVFYLEGNHMHPCIQMVPALVLDCEPNIDFSRDVEAKRQYARQVAGFFDFVKRKKQEAPDVSGTESRNQQILLPQKDSLWVPRDGRFPGSALKSLEFRKAMSSFMP